MPDLDDDEEELTDREIRPDRLDEREGDLAGGRDLTVIRSLYPCVEIISGPGEGMRIPLSEGENGIGRAAGNTIKLDDSSVSRNHAIITRHGASLEIKDLGSRNGSIVNGTSMGADTVVPLAHLDKIRVGIYILRVLREAGAPEELEENDMIEMRDIASKPLALEGRELPTSPKKSQAETPPPGPLGTRGAAAPPLMVPMASVDRVDRRGEAADQVGPADTVARRLSLVMGFIALFILFLGGLWVYRSQFGNGRAEPVATVSSQAPASEAAQVPEQGAARTAEIESQTVPAEPLPASVASVFMRITASPLPARLSLDGQDLGSTPLERNMDFELGKTYTVKAQYALAEIGESFHVTQEIQIAPGQDTLSLVFDAELGTLKFVQIPRDTKVYLEAEFAHDPQDGKSIKFEELVYNKPMLVPYGRYVLELRGVPAARPGTTQEEILYRRPFVLGAEHRLEEIAVSEELLAIFPADIQSTPEGAEILYDGKKMGETPWQGDLAVGKHELVIRKPGFEEHRIAVETWRHEPAAWSVALKTSRAGILIFQAKGAYKDKAYEKAIDLLGKALAEDPSEFEKNESYYHLAQAYKGLNACDKSIHYFNRVVTSGLKYEAKLGLADCYQRMGEQSQALLALAEVLLGSPQKSLLTEAEVLFHKVTPLRSVVYLNTEPKEAVITVNNQEVPDRSPLILSDLSIGSYRLLARLPGYADQELSIDLKMSEFRPILMKLKPLK